MTDKEKFRKEVEKLKSSLIHGACSSQIAMETRCKEEAYNEVLAILDTMQEEPVSKVWHYANEHPEIEKPILLRKVNGVVELSICHDENFYPEIGEMWAYIEDLLNLSNVESTVKNLKEPVSKNYRERYKRIAQSEKFKKTYEGMSVGEIMHVEGEEPVGDDLGEYINELSKQFPEVSFAKLSRIAVRVAKWQKQKDKTKVLTEEQCRKIRDDAFELGKDAMKQQLMKGAVEGEIVKDIANNLYIGKAKVNKNNFKFGDKVKLLVLKEE